MTPLYRETLLDWAISELMSPHWASVEDSPWAEPQWSAWREAADRNGPRTWTQDQEQTLIQAISIIRKPIIDLYGPWPTQKIQLASWTRDDILQLNVMPEFFPPGGSLAQFARWIETNSDYAPDKSRAIAAIGSSMTQGRMPLGRLIVAKRPGGHVLVEGYKRALAILGFGAGSTAPVIELG